MIGSYHNIFRLGVALQDLGFWIQNDVIWRKTNPMPNFRGKRFTNAHETLIWAGRDAKSRVTFNYEAMKALNDDIQMRSDWLFPICSGPERLKDGEGRKAHPTQKPEALLHRILLASTNPGDLVLDPFFGTGTTGAVGPAARPPLARHRARSRSTPRPPRSASPRCGRCRPRRWRPPSPSAPSRACPSAPSSSCGILEPGHTLTDERGRLRAEVRADGTLAVAGRQGSIHRLGAEVQGKTACNGWTFWHYEVEGVRKPIDVLREQARRQLGLSAPRARRRGVGAAPSHAPLARGDCASAGRTRATTKLHRLSLDPTWERGEGEASHRGADLPGHELVVAVAEQLRSWSSRRRRRAGSSSKISWPFSSIETPSRMSPQLMSMSSIMRL